MRRYLYPQLWLSLARELWHRNRDQNLNQVAASLAFTTTLSLVPMITVASILISYLPSVIQIKNAFQSWLLDTYMPGGINQQLFIYLNQFSSKAQGLTLAGLVGLLVTTILAMAVIERAFNEIFQVQERRPFVKRLAIYSAVTILGPVLLGFGTYLSGRLLSAAEGWTDSLPLDLEIFATLLPVFLAFAVYSVVYKVLPYAKVKFRDAFLGALCAALAFELMKFGFGVFLTKVPFYKTVYGTFAILPLALIWVYLTWWVTLAGAVLVANLPLIRAGFTKMAIFR